MVKLEPNNENGLYKISSADAFQVRSVSQERFVRRLGALSDENLLEINKALMAILAIR